MARWFRTSIVCCRLFRWPVPQCLAVLRFHTPLIEPGGRISRTGLSDKEARPRLRRRPGRGTPPGVSEPFAEVIGVRHSPGSHAPSDALLELGSLPSTGITRFRRSYGPVRHPKRPDLALAGLRLRVRPAPPGASRVASDLRMPTCRRHYPGGTTGSRRFTGCDPQFPSDSGLPRFRGGSAPTLRLSRPAQRSLALRPACSRNRLIHKPADAFWFARRM